MDRDEQRLVGQHGDPAPLPGRVGIRDSLRTLAVTNAATIGIALWQGWPLVFLLWPYWLQSLIIGWYYGHERIMALPEGPDTGATPAKRQSDANFFVMHYGGFHAGYLLFLVMATPAAKAGWLDVVILAALGVSFVFTHRAASKRIIAADVVNRPHINSAGPMGLPYLRIIPMHIAFMVGLGAAKDGWWVILLFGVLKTLADMAMHYVEYRVTAPKLQSQA